MKHYLDKLNVAIVQLDIQISLGDILRFDCPPPRIPFVQKIGSMQMDRKDIRQAKAGEAIGLKTDKPVKEGDPVIRLEFVK